MDFLFVIGSNTTETHPIISIEMKKAVSKGATLVVADPRKIELVDVADMHLQLKAGSNILLLNAMAYVIIEEGLYNEEFIKTRTEGFEETKEGIKNFSPEAVERYTGVSADLIRKTARGYAKAENAAIYYTMGITQHTSGVNNVLAIANLALLTGHIGKPNSGVNPLRGQNNVQGACDMGALPNVFPGYQPVNDANVSAKFSAAWGVELSQKPGLTVGEMLDGAADGSVKGLFILGENPMVSDPDINHVKHALEHLDFFVVQDLFLTETAQLADVVFPGASFAEKDGTFSNTERRVQRVRKAIEPVGNSKADWEIIAELATRMGYKMEYNSAEEVMQEIAQVTPSYGGINYARLEEGGIQWPCPNDEHLGTKFLHNGQFARGKGQFHALDFAPPAEIPDEEYPLLLTTGRRLTHYHTGSMTRRSKGLDEMYSKEHLEINQADACKLGIEDGSLVKVSSRRGEITITAHVTERVTSGTVFSTFHFAETNVNYLTNSARDPKCKIPELKVCAVKVEKVS